jgi:ATP-binding cassette subfamily C protein
MGLVVFLYGMMGILDFVRGRIMGRAGARFQARLDRRVFEASVRKSAIQPDQTSASGLRDLETVQKLMTSPVLMAVFDLPWTPIFLAGIFLFHPLLGILALVGGALLVIVALVNQFTTRKPVVQSGTASAQSEALATQIRNEAETVQSMGMLDAAYSRWQISRKESLKSTLGYADLGGMFTATTKAFRLFLQSAMLGVGAYLVLKNQLTPGAMIAGSILLGRALQPIEQLVGQWPMIVQARKSWSSLALLLSVVPEQVEKTALPRPASKLRVEQITVVPPGERQASLRMISFGLNPGQALGVIGPSGSGKSTLARVLTGVWRPSSGKVRLDGASLDQFEPSVLGKHIGYLPQRVQLFDGTIAQNIAHLSMDPNDEQVVAAAKKADAHDMILKLPDGYDTQVSSALSRLSGGQMQRIGLARAMYGDPVIVILDEPNSNLDNEGSIALNKAIRAMKEEGRAVLVMAHRPAAIKECDLLLMLENGQRKAFGPRDEVLRQVTTNHQKIQSAQTPGGVS